MPLLKVVGINPNIRKKFSAVGINSAEHLVALAATPGGIKGVAKYLNMDEQNARKVIETAKRTLPKKVIKQMSKPAALAVALGARKPERRKQFEAKVAQHPGETPTREASQFSNITSIATETPTPPEVNLIPKMTKIKSQGTRGTCVAFSCVALREFLAESKPDLSEQFLYWWCDAHDRVPEEPGTTVANGVQGLYQAGVCLENTWRYVPYPISGNEGQGPPPSGAAEEAKNYKVLSIIDIDENSLQELKNCLKGTSNFKQRPISFAIPVYNSWFKSEAVRLSGQITMPLPGEAVEGGHAMLIVGYQIDPEFPGGGFFIIRNSWGQSWGEKCVFGKGYGTIPFNYITQYCWEAYTAEAEPIKNGGPCVIATAAYGSQYAPEVQFLRNFRDYQLRSNESGRAFIRFYENIYYSFSPYIANKMRQSKSVKNIFRWFVVAPIVYTLKKIVGLLNRNGK
jgi:hypothetical protein